jgi:hypothetical protein
MSGRHHHDVNDGERLSALLGPLGANGGPTQTISPVPDGSSPHKVIAIIPAGTVIPAGSGVLCPTTDQRGYTSRAGAACDAGAYQTTGRRQPPA